MTKELNRKWCKILRGCPAWQVAICQDSEDRLFGCPHYRKTQKIVKRERAKWEIEIEKWLKDEAERHSGTTKGDGFDVVYRHFAGTQKGTE